MKQHRDRLRDLLKLTFASAAEDEGELATTLFLELANQLLTVLDRDVVDTALLVASAKFLTTSDLST